MKSKRIMNKYILTGYIEEALIHAEYDKLEDGTFSGRIPSCKGVIAFGKTLLECEAELRSTLEDWIVLGLKLGHPLPVFRGCHRKLSPQSTAQAANTLSPG